MPSKSSKNIKRTFCRGVKIYLKKHNRSELSNIENHLVKAQGRNIKKKELCNT